MMSRLTARLGRRGMILAANGTIFAVYGVSVLTSRAPLFGGFVPFGDTDPHLLGCVWIICGTLAAAAAADVRGRWGAAGYTALLLPPAIWALLHLWSWLAWLFGMELSNGRGWSSASIWGAQIVVILVVAGWPEPREDTG